jgi:hypothetical protein
MAVLTAQKANGRLRRGLTYAYRLAGVCAVALGVKTLVASYRDTCPSRYLAFRTVTPNFAHYEVDADGVPPALVEASKFDWSLHPGANTLSVCSVSQFSVRGIESTVRVTLAADSGAPAAARVPGRFDGALRHE